MSEILAFDWYTKEIIGYTLSLQSKTDQWLDALETAVNSRFPEGIRDTLEKDLFLVSDNGCQPTSQRYMEACATLGIKQIFASWSNPKGNAETERVFRTLREYLIWPNDWDHPFEFQRALDTWIDNYNNDFPHQTLNYMTPAQFHEKTISKPELVLS